MKPLFEGTHHAGLQMNLPSDRRRTALSLVFRFVVREPILTGRPVNDSMLYPTLQIDSDIPETLNWNTVVPLHICLGSSDQRLSDLPSDEFRRHRLRLILTLDCRWRQVDSWLWIIVGTEAEPGPDGE